MSESKLVPQNHLVPQMFHKNVVFLCFYTGFLLWNNERNHDFTNSVDAFLTFRGYQILPDKGKVSSERAMKKAYAEYDEFNSLQKITSDFDKFIEN